MELREVLEKTPEEIKDFNQQVTSRLPLFDFLNKTLGYHDMNNVHKDLCKFLTDKFLFKLILMPRYSFKSCICSVGYSLWRLVRDPNLRILIYSDASSKAQGFLTSIKAQIEGKVADAHFGTTYDWSSDGRETKWNESQIVIKGRTTQYAEPSVDTGGIETSKVGMHYDIIIFDDIVSDINITTKDQMDKTANCYRKALSLLKPGGEVMVVGTRWHFGDLYGRIIAENSEMQNFRIFIVDGVEDEKYGSYCFSNIGDPGLNKEFLDQQKKQQGTYTFSCLYRNRPTDPETAVFKTTDFAFYGAIKKDDLYITCTCDPAGEGEDFTAITVVGTDHQMNMHIFEVVNAKMQPSELVDKIINLNYKYNFNMFGLETNFYRGMLHQALEERINEERQENPGFKLFGTHEFQATRRKGEGKHTRILGLQPYHERGAIRFPGTKLELLTGEFSDLAYQMIQFPNAAHDDIIDSLAYHISLIRRGGLAKKAELPRNSPAWLERQAYEKEIVHNNSLPRRLRRTPADLSFS